MVVVFAIVDQKLFAEDENEHARAISRRTLNNVRSFLTAADLEFMKDHPVNVGENANQILTVIKTYNFTVRFSSFSFPKGGCSGFT